MAGLWWAGFTLFTLKKLKEAGAIEEMPEKYQSQPKIVAYTAIGITRTLATIRKVRRFKHLLLFLIAFMIYNDGDSDGNQAWQRFTGKEELGFSATVLMITLLMIQIIAAGGALLFGRIASKIGAKRALMLALLLWSGVVTYAYFLHTVAEFFILGDRCGDRAQWLTGTQSFLLRGDDSPRSLG